VVLGYVCGALVIVFYAGFRIKSGNDNVVGFQFPVVGFQYNVGSIIDGGCDFVMRLRLVYVGV